MKFATHISPLLNYFYSVVTLQTVLDHLNTKLVLHSDPHSTSFLQNTTHSTRLDRTMVKFDLAMIIIACYQRVKCKLFIKRLVQDCCLASGKK